MTLTIAFDGLLADIDSAYNKSTLKRDYYENYLNDQIGSCTMVNVLRFNPAAATGIDFQVIDSFPVNHPKSKIYIRNTDKISIPREHCPELEKVLFQINIQQQDLLEIQKPIKHASNTVLFLSNDHWSNLTNEQLIFLYFASKFQELEKQCYAFLKHSLLELGEKHVKRSIQKLQRMLVDWSTDLIQLFHLDRLSRSRSQKLQYDRYTLFSHGYDCLENILVHLEKHYSKYLDKDLFVPFSVISSRVNCLKPKVERLKTTIITKKYDAQFNELLFTPLLMISNVSQKKRITYQQLMFVEVLVDRLFRFYYESKDKPNNIEQLHLVLLGLNYNCPLYYAYLTSKMNERLESLEKHESLMQLLKWMKAVNQTVVIEDIGFKSNHKPLRYWIEKWLEEEIWFLNETEKSNPVGQEKNTSSDPLPKMELDCSVNELALLIRLFSETGIIGVKNHKVLMQQVSQTFQTSKVKEISPKSLSNKYYEADDTTIASVKGIIIDLLNHLNSK